MNGQMNHAPSHYKTMAHKQIFHYLPELVLFVFL